MASNIDAAVPPFGNATTAGVRANFAAAKAEIEALQQGVLDGVIVPESEGVGIRVDQTTPTFPWRDLIGDVTPKSTGPGSPTLGAWRGGSTRAFFYSAGDDGDIVFHIPHDYVPGSDLFIHAHWGHNGTAISGSLIINLYMTYAKGHNQSAFPAEVLRQLTMATPDIATVPQWCHCLPETQISSMSPAASQIDSALIEPDGLLMVHFDVNTIPTISGGSTNEPAIFTLDLHYQSTNIGTKQKAPDFWTP